jgi:hypothetical protein
MKIMKMKNLLYIGLSLFLAFQFTACTSDLETEQRGPLVQPNPYSDAANYPLLVAKVYAGFSRLGITGPDGGGDIPSSSDQGKTNFLRTYFNIQELTSDEAKCAWSDNDEKNYSQTILGADNYIGYMLYQRCMLNIVFANEFLKNTKAPAVQVADLDRMRAEVRTLRAMNYFFLLDVYGNPGWVTEDQAVTELPKQLGREGLFNWVESELLDIEKGGLLKDYSVNSTYGLATKQLVQTLLAKLYLNAEVYTGKARWNDALTYAKKVTTYSGLALESTYQNLFCADNNRSKEIILALPYDNTEAQDWGGMTFVMASSTSGDMAGSLLDFNASWAGNRATQQLTNLFASNDKRALFFTDKRDQNMTELNNFEKGWSVMKFTNRGWNGAENPNGIGQWVDTDFPLFRLADVILIQAEAELRLGDATNALIDYNKVHAHARTGLSAAAYVTLDDILAERGRELYWEAQRRTDLIRFGKFAKGYNWAWKGGVKDGVDIDKKYELLPISTKHLTGNPALVQNELYR